MKIQPPPDPQKSESLTGSKIGADAGSVGLLSARLLELRRDLMERDRVVASLLERIETTNKALADRSDLLAKIQVHLETLHLALTRRQEECDFLVTSRSWKMTAPLRLAGRALRKIKHAAFGTGPSAPARDAGRFKESEVGNLPEKVIRQQGAIVSTASLDRTEILRRTLEETLGRPDNKTAEARYVHRVADALNVAKLNIRAIAFYVPEFYPDPKSDEFRMFSDWSHFTKALPRYLGHYQPHLPIEPALNDQRIPHVTRAQIELARQYGIHGFCFQSYWSPGGLLRNEPLERFLADRSLDFHFCICCSSESCQGVAGGPGDGPLEWPPDDVFVGALGAAFSDPRYIRVDERPVLIVYRADRMPDVAARARLWKKRALSMGLPGLFLVNMRRAKGSLQGSGDFDAVLDDPLAVSVPDVTSAYLPIDSNFRGRIYNYESLVDEQSRSLETPGLTFRHVMTGWDNEARRPREGNSFVDSSPALYAKWLDLSCRQTMQHRPQERLLFISAWNNWAEGAHLEPDRRFGYAYLHTTANVLRYYHHDPPTEELIARINAAFSPSSDVAIIFHCYYEDLITPIFDHYFSRNNEADLFVTVRYDVTEDAIQQMQSRFPKIYFIREENRGRDIRPFLVTLRHIRALGYRVACKVHTKKTPQALDHAGELWRQSLIEPLLGCPDSASQAVGVFEREHDLGLLVPKNSMMDLRINDNHAVNRYWLDRFLDRMDRRDLIGDYTFSFPAGSMYWVRLEALTGFEEMVLTPDEFEFELGQRDGTVAHAVERLVALYVQQRGYRMKEIAGLEAKPLP